MKPASIAVAVAALIAGFAAGTWLARPAAHAPPVAPAGDDTAVQFWTCSMHPNIRQPGPGTCPICGMALIPVPAEPDTQALGPRQLRLSPAAQQLAEIDTAPVERRFVAADIRMVGKVEYDESRLAEISAWIPGRLERLFVDYTGVPVNKGEHLVLIYSPDLLVAQRELLLARQTAAAARGGDRVLQERHAATLHAAREKLRLWGLSPEQIEDIERRAQPSDRLTIHSPISGIVVQKDALEGRYVNTGDPIYRIADLSQVWVRLDAYESDLSWIHYGQEVEFTPEAYPGDVLTGRIAFVDPVLNPVTRTVKVRVNVPNPDGRLKPGMFVRAVVRSQLASGGKVMDPALAGKWICPMHPEIIKGGPGSCDICGMALVSAESLGYLRADAAHAEAPLVVPASAPLITGTRAVVYVAVPDRPGTFEGRDIALGERAGDFYVVADGLREGELVVVKGNFKLDSESQIQAKPSMMNPGDTTAPPAHAHHD